MQVHLSVATFHAMSFFFLFKEFPQVLFFHFMFVMCCSICCNNVSVSLFIFPFPFFELLLRWLFGCLVVRLFGCLCVWREGEGGGGWGEADGGGAGQIGSPTLPFSFRCCVIVLFELLHSAAFTGTRSVRLPSGMAVVCPIRQLDLAICIRIVLDQLKPVLCSSCVTHLQ